MQPAWVANQQCHTTCLTLATLVQSNILLLCMVVHRGNGSSSWAKWLQSTVCIMQPTWVANQQCHTTCLTVATLVESNILLLCMVVHRGNGFKLGKVTTKHSVQKAANFSCQPAVSHNMFDGCNTSSIKHLAVLHGCSQRQWLQAGQSDYKA